MLVIETMAFPPVEFMRELAHHDTVEIEQHEHYNKRSFRNRYDILGPNGAIPLVIPLRKGKNNGRLITEVLIADDTHWPPKHIHAIQSAYGRAPYFEDYFPFLRALFEDIPPTLFEFNVKALSLVLRLAGIRIDLQRTKHFIPYNSNEFEVIKDYYTPNSIDKIPSNPYIQVFSDRFPFVPGLCILDLLFNIGPETILFLRTSRLIQARKDIAS